MNKSAQFRSNYDYGEGLFSNLDKYDSVSNFRKKRRKKRKKDIENILNSRPDKYKKKKASYKLAVIRDQRTECPFGLPIPFACKTAANSVDKMESLVNNELATTSNLGKLENAEEKGRCKYAAHLFEDRGAVDCNFGDTAAGLKPNSFVGSPYYDQIFDGKGMSGVLTAPISPDPSGETTRNLYYGMQGYTSTEFYQQILKTAINDLIAK